MICYKNFTFDGDFSTVLCGLHYSPQIALNIGMPDIKELFTMFEWNDFYKQQRVEYIYIHRRVHGHFFRFMTTHLKIYNPLMTFDRINCIISIKPDSMQLICNSEWML